jgi:hypothetical protein
MPPERLTRPRLAEHSRGPRTGQTLGDGRRWRAARTGRRPDARRRPGAYPADVAVRSSGDRYATSRRLEATSLPRTERGSARRSPDSDPRSTGFGPSTWHNSPCMRISPVWTRRLSQIRERRLASCQRAWRRSWTSSRVQVRPSDPLPPTEGSLPPLFRRTSTSMSSVNAGLSSLAGEDHTVDDRVRFLVRMNISIR